MTWRAPLSGDGPEKRRAHADERERWKPIVAAGRATCQQGLPGNGSSGTCVMPTRWIAPRSRWALGHTDDRTGWIWPVHHRCNLLDAASRGGKARAAKHGPWRGPGQGGATTPRLPVGR